MKNGRFLFQSSVKDKVECRDDEDEGETVNGGVNYSPCSYSRLLKLERHPYYSSFYCIPGSRFVCCTIF